MNEKARLKQFTLKIHKVAKGLLQKQGELKPHLILSMPEGHVYIDLPPYKELWRPSVIAITKVLGVKMFCFCAEAWVSITEKNGKLLVMPKRDPYRREMLVITAYSKNHKIAIFEEFTEVAPRKFEFKPRQMKVDSFNIIDYNFADIL